MQSIINEGRGRNIDVRVALSQIGTITLLSCGAQMKTLVYDTDYVKFKVSRRFWLVVKLNAKDEYDLEVATVRKGEYKVVEQMHDVPAFNLPGAVRKIGDRA